MVGPAAPSAAPTAGGKKRKVLKFERTYLDSLPCAEMYERSYMHRDEINHVVVTKKYVVDKR